jgi:hypothetical protein
VSNVLKRTRMRKRRAKSVDERPVLTEMKISRSIIRSVLDDGQVEQCRYNIYRAERDTPWMKSTSVHGKKRT